MCMCVCVYLRGCERKIHETKLENEEMCSSSKQLNNKTEQKQEKPKQKQEKHC